MALHNTTDRYKYIYGSNVRKLEPEEKKLQKDTGAAVYRSTRLQQAAMPDRNRHLSTAEKARLRRNHEKTQTFDGRFMVVAVFALFLIAASAVHYVQGMSRINTLSNQVSVLKTQKSEELSKQAALRTEIEKSVNLDEIRKYAEKELHMVYPDQKQVIYYKDGADDYFRQYESVDVNK